MVMAMVGVNVKMCNNKYVLLLYQVLVKLVHI